MTIYAKESRTVIRDTDIFGHILQIIGEAKCPFVHGVRFINCTIIADDLRAFDSCYFDQDCNMVVKNMPLCGIESINNNAVFCENKGKQDD